MTRPLVTPEGFRWGPVSINWQQYAKNGTVSFRVETMKGKITFWVTPDGGVVIHPWNDDIITKGVPHEMGSTNRVVGSLPPEPGVRGPDKPPDGG